MKFAAIDIGSNAVRLLLSRVVGENGQALIKKESLVRMPIRLGDDAFLKQYIGEEKKTALIHSMQGFRHLIEAYQPLAYRACATSAMREAKNGEEIASRIKSESGIELEIIRGETEAALIFANHDEAAATLPFMYIDVGGGSTELTVFDQGKVIDARSFNIGTIRLLEDLVSKVTWQAMKDWLQNFRSLKNLTGIGSGGNINKIYRLSGRKDGKPMSYKSISTIHDMLREHTFEERIRRLKLRPDRADVILPASEIYLSVMKWAGIRQMQVPQVGLADGIIHDLYRSHLESVRPADS